MPAQIEKFEDPQHNGFAVQQLALGHSRAFLDIHINATTRWKGVPVETWNYTLGGYQVLKKWLSYREQTLLHRPLTPDEAEQLTHHTRRITAILAENAALDAHYESSP